MNFVKLEQNEEVIFRVKPLMEDDFANLDKKSQGLFVNHSCDYGVSIVVYKETSTFVCGYLFNKIENLQNEDGKGLQLVFLCASEKQSNELIKEISNQLDNILESYNDGFQYVWTNRESTTQIDAFIATQFNLEPIIDGFLIRRM